MEIIIAILVMINIVLIGVINKLSNKYEYAKEEAEKAIFELFMKDAYEQRLLWFKTLNRDANVPSTVFIGDSLIQEWPIQEMFQNSEYLNRGIGGDTTANLLNRLETSFKHLTPTRVVILIGTNDLVQPDFDMYLTVSRIQESIKKIQIMYPKIAIYLCSLLPVGNPKIEKMDKQTIGVRDNQTIDAINEALSQIESINYLNINEVLKDEQGYLNPQYSREGLHLSPEGYKAVVKLFKEHGF